ncbi:peptidylprolyl isomerase [Brevibacillus dissolubilis]|uniref:peptidylprolyl isomerase n=1 Tax=Brevibacillus dissolubilis TaxID=1844116 RepID=UPI001116CC71|nr:peptidylprolyl isomerase [Brevibacillus dissolubilis]
MKKYALTLTSLLLTASLVTGCGGGNQTDEHANHNDSTQTGQPADQATQPDQANQTPPAGDVGPTGEKKWDKPPAMQIDPNKSYTATITTTMGDIKIELFAKDAPKTVNNFVFLAKEDFYDGIIFHRVMKTFMIQTGDPLGNGMGGPGYRFEDELNNGHKYEVGVVAMANAGPNTNGSQFFIGSGDDITGLEFSPDYTIFGKVIEGQDVVNKIASVPVKAGASGEASSPVTPVSMKDVKIEEK